MLLVFSAMRCRERLVVRVLTGRQWKHWKIAPLGKSRFRYQHGKSLSLLDFCAGSPYPPIYEQSGRGVWSILNNIEGSGTAVEAGLAILNQGGGFADGLIAYEGTWLGGEVFVSFDKKAVSWIAKQGQKARLFT
jgi:hypothetical protein